VIRINSAKLKLDKFSSVGRVDRKHRQSPIRVVFEENLQRELYDPRFTKRIRREVNIW